MRRIILLFPLLLIATAAFAQTVVVAEPTIWDNLQAAVYTALGLVVTAAITWGATWVRAKFKVDIEQKWRDALHSAIMSGILLGLKQVGFSDKAGSLTQAAGVIPKISDVDKNAVVNVAVDYARNSVPEAIKGLMPKGDVGGIIAGLAKGKLEGVLGGILPAVAAGGLTTGLKPS